MDDLMEQQRALESYSRQQSAERIQHQNELANKRGDGSQTSVSRCLMRTIMGTLTEAMTANLAKNIAGVPGRSAGALALLKDAELDVETMAYLALVAVIDTVAMPSTALGEAALAKRIGTTIAEELRFRQLKKENHAIVGQWEKDQRKESRSRTAARVQLRRDLISVGLDLQYTSPAGFVWDDVSVFKVGRCVLETIIQTTGILERRKRRRLGTRHATEVLIVPAQVYMEWIERAEIDAAMYRPVYIPMVVPPRPWDPDENVVGGGYITDNVPSYPLVKRKKSEYMFNLLEQDCQPVFDAINAVQSTPWRINKNIVEVLHDIYADDTELAGIPRSSRQDLPPAPEEHSQEYKRQCWMVHEKNRKDLTRRLYINRILMLCDMYKDNDAIYFPHDMDSRGRMYPKCSHLSPQGPDFVKGLLEFSEGKPLGPDGAYWLAVHTANCAGQDKLPMDERVSWVEDNSAMICAYAKDPSYNRGWSEADEPFQFLQACMAWQGFCKEGESYVCRVPIAMDATCSGLQHYSALLKDRTGGTSVNLTASPVRRDVYADVAAKATEILEEYEGTDEEGLARAWKEFGIDRKITKRSVMVVPYAATFSSCLTYISDSVREREEKGDVVPWEGDVTKFNRFGATIIWRAIGEVVIAAREAMEWIKECVKIYAHETNAALEWTVPSGFLVEQEKRKKNRKRSDTHLHGKRVQFVYYEDLQDLDPNKMGTSTPPSYIHSLDAAHLCLTLVRAQSEGIHNFAVVHDSFATHACDTTAFSRCIREAFHEMYADYDLLESFRDHLKLGLESDFPPTPSRGDLDPSEVLQSEFFFS